jgi:hypothetical protein
MDVGSESMDVLTVTDNETMKEKCSQGTTVEQITPVIQEHILCSLSQ